MTTQAEQQEVAATFEVITSKHAEEFLSDLLFGEHKHSQYDIGWATLTIGTHSKLGSAALIQSPNSTSLLMTIGHTQESKP